MSKQPKLSTSKSRVPEQLLDWKKVREAKNTVCKRCRNNNILLGGCSLGLVPSMDCARCEKVRD